MAAPRTKVGFKGKIASAGEWLKAHPGKTVALCAAAAVFLVGAAGATYHAINGDFKFGKAKKQNSVLVDQNQQLEDQNQQLTGEKEGLEKENQELKDKFENGEFDPTADPAKEAEYMKRIKASMAGKQGSNLQFAEYSCVGDNLTLFFTSSAYNDDLKKINTMVVVEMKAPTKPFNTESVIAALESREKKYDINISTYLNAEDLVKGDEEKAAISSLAGAIEGKKAETTIYVNDDGSVNDIVGAGEAQNADTMYCIKQERNGNNYTVLSVSAVSKNADGKYEVVKLGTEWESQYASADAANVAALTKFAQEKYGISNADEIVSQAVAQAKAQEETEAE